MAVRRKLAGFAEMMLKQYMQQRQMEAQSELVRQRQVEASEQSFEQSILGKATSDPAFAERLRASGRSQIGKTPMEVFIPTEDQAVGSAATEIAGISDLQKLPTQMDIEMSNRGRPGFPQRDPTPIGDLIRQRTEREAAIKAGTSPIAMTALNPEHTASEQTFRNPWEKLNQPAQTTMTGAEKGVQDLATLQTPGLAAETAKQAGREASATGYGSQAGQIKARWDHRAILIAAEKQLSEARGTGNTRQAQQAEKLIQSEGERLKILATALTADETDRFTARTRGLGRSFSNFTGIPGGTDGPLLLNGKPVLSAKGLPMSQMDGYNELESLRQGLTSIFLRRLGRPGTPTENDESRTRELLPAANLTMIESQNRNGNFDKILQAAGEIGDALGPVLDGPAGDAEIARRIGLIEQRMRNEVPNSFSFDANDNLIQGGP